MDSDWFGYVWLLRVARVQSVTGAGVLISPSAPSVRHWDRLCSCRQGYMVGVVLFTGVTLLPLWIADQVRNDGHAHDTSTLWFPAYAGMTVCP